MDKEVVGRRLWTSACASQSCGGTGNESCGQIPTPYAVGRSWRGAKGRCVTGLSSVQRSEPEHSSEQASRSAVPTDNRLDGLQWARIGHCSLTPYRQDHWPTHHMSTCPAKRTPEPNMGVRSESRPRPRARPHDPRPTHLRTCLLEPRAIFGETGLAHLTIDN